MKNLVKMSSYKCSRKCNTIWMVEAFWNCRLCVHSNLWSMLHFESSWRNVQNIRSSVLQCHPHYASPRFTTFQQIFHYISTPINDIFSHASPRQPSYITYTHNYNTTCFSLQRSNNALYIWPLYTGEIFIKMHVRKLDTEYKNTWL